MVQRELDSIFKIRIRRNHIFYHFINIIDFIFQKIKDRNPAFTSGFHADIKTVIVEKPLLEFKNRIVKGGKAFPYVRRFNATSSFNNCGNEKKIANIDITTGLISNFYSQTPFVNDKKLLTEQPHN